MKFYFWPNKRQKSYDRETGKTSTGLLPEGVECPKCHKTLLYFYKHIRNKRYDGVYCSNCGRDFRKPITKWEKLRYWCKWMGDKKIMSKWPIGSFCKEVAK